MNSVLSKAGSIFSDIKGWVLFVIAVLLIAYATYNISTGVYTLLTDCWVCGVFENIYDTFSKVSYQTFYLFQNDSLKILSICLALWIVFETYKIFIKGVSINPKIDIDSGYLKKIYRKLFLATFVIGALLLNSPRNIFSNTYELVLDFGSGIGRGVLRKKIDTLQLTVPPECDKDNTKLIYKEGMALSENTKENMVCLFKEVDLLRQTYMNIGIELFEYGMPQIIIAGVVNVSIRLAGFFGGRALQHFGSEKWLKNMQKKIGKIEVKIQKQKNGGKDTKKTEESLKKLKDKLDEVLQDVSGNGGKNIKRTQKTGKVISNNASRFANITSIVAFITNDNIRMGLCGIAIVIGLFLVNMLFAFIIIENVLFMGVALLIFPFLAVCYVFEQTRSYATAGLSKLFGFAKGLVFMCVAIIICNELNDWVLGGMFSFDGMSRMSSAKYALKLLQEGNIKEFNNLVGFWYFLYIIFALVLNFKIITETNKFAGWFGGNISESNLGRSIWNTSKSFVNWTKSTTRNVAGFAKNTSSATGLIKDKIQSNAKDKSEASNETKS